MKKTLLFIWYLLSFLLLTFGVFLNNDEFISRKELLIIAAVLLSAGGLSYISLRITSEESRKIAFVLSAMISFAVCFVLESRSPLYVFIPDDPTVSVTTGDTPIRLNWAFWAKTPPDLHTNIYDWKGWKDIRPEQLTFSDNWHKEDEFLACVGECSIRFPEGIHLHQPILSFKSENPLVIYAGEHPYDVQPNIITPVFVSGLDVSRQFIFAVLFTGVCGVLCCTLSFPAVLLQSCTSRKPAGLLIYTLSFLLPGACLLLIARLLNICPFGENTFLLSDMQCQYVDFLVHLRTLFREGRSLFYSFSKSIGDDYLSLFAYYLSNPLDWIIAFFPEDRIPEAVSLLVMVRYALCGLSSAVYFRHVFKTKGETLVFSTAYALMSLNFVIAEHTQLRSGVLIIPLVFLGIDRIIQHKGGLVYYLTLSAAMLLNYYSGFQICCFAVPYFFCRLFLINNEGKLRTALRFGIWSLLTAGTCAVLLIPVVLQLGGGMKTFDLSVFTAEPNFRVAELLGKLFNSAFDKTQTLTSGLPNIFCGVMVPFCIPLFLLNRRITKREKVSTLALLAVCFLTMWINALNLIVHGFNEPVWWPYRYSFAVSLILLLPVLSCFRSHEGNTPANILLCAIFTGGILLIINSRHFSWFTGSAFALNLLLCAMFCVIFYLTRGSILSKTSVLLFVFLDLFLNGWMILGDKTANQRSEISSSFNTFFEENRAIIEQIKTRDKDFYRIEKTYFHDANDSFLLDYSGISHFSSTLKYKIMQFLPAAGYRFYPTRFEYGEGSTVTMDSLLGIRYLITDAHTIGKPYNAVFSAGNKNIYRNPYALPIGFMTGNNSALNENILQAADTFSMQNLIFEALTGNPDPVFQIADAKMIKDDGNEISWQMTCGSTGTLYARFNSETENLASLEVNGIKIADYFDGRGHPVLRLGSFVTDEVIEVTLRTADNTQTLHLTEALFAYENPFLLLAETGKLRDGSLTITSRSDAELQGTVNSAADGRLFLSIPFDRGWHLFVDGKKTELVPAFDMFLSAELAAGEHEIQLKYIPRGLNAGMIISTISLLCALTVLIAERKKYYLKGISQSAVKRQ